MTRTLPRTKFHSTSFLRCLVNLDLVDVVDPGNAFAEKLGQWVHFADAITLSAVHNDGAAGVKKNPQETRRSEEAAAQAAIRVEFDRIQSLLANSIAKSCSRNAGKTHISLPAPEIELPMNLAAAYTPYRRFMEAHQRDMEISIQPLRFNVRAAMAKTSPRLRKLAELDATLEKILQDREKHLLAKVPLMLRKRFEQLFKEHQQNLADTRQTDNPAAWAQPGGWLARFCNDLQTLLLAELELRLQPTMGLIEAFRQDTQ